MSTAIFIDKRCFICEETGKYPEVGMMHLGAPAYLDGRPADSHSSVLYMFIQQCPCCGYSAIDISKGNEQIVEIVKTEKYRLQAFSKEYPVTANRYLCWAMLQEKLGRINEAGLAALYASWVCDDEGKSAAQSESCRAAAIFCFERARVEALSFGDNSTEELLLLVDLARRNSDFERALNYCLELQKLSLTENQQLTVNLQIALAEDGDTLRHYVSEIYES